MCLDLWSESCPPCRVPCASLHAICADCVRKKAEEGGAAPRPIARSSERMLRVQSSHEDDGSEAADGKPAAALTPLGKLEIGDEAPGELEA